MPDDEYALAMRKAIGILADYGKHLCSICPAKDECDLKDHASDMAIEEAKTTHSREEWEKLGPVSKAEYLLGHNSMMIKIYAGFGFPKSLVVPSGFIPLLQEASAALKKSYLEKGRVNIPIN